MLEFACSSCGQHIQGDDAHAGKLVQCPVCGLAMTVPGNPAITAIAAQPPGAPAAAANDAAFSEGVPPVGQARRIAMPQEVPHVLRRCVPYFIGACVVAIVIGLIVPALQKVRESAARTQSINNLKYLGLAFHGFHDQHRRLPFNGTKPAVGGDATSGSWAFMIMQLEQNRMFLDVNRGAGVPFLMCPGRGRPLHCNGVGGPGAWTDYFINPFLNDPNGVPNAPDIKRTLIGITDGTSNTILVGHGQVIPADYSSADVTAGFTDVIFNGGSVGLCRANRNVVNGRDSAGSLPGNWGGPFAQGSLMAMGDATVRIFPYSLTGGVIDNGTCADAKWARTEQDFGDGPGFIATGPFGVFLTPRGGEALTIPDS